MLAVRNRLKKGNGWSCSSKLWHPPRLGCDCLSNSCRSGVLRRNEGGTIRRAPNQITVGASNHCGGAEWLRGAPKSPNIAKSTFFNAAHLLPKDLRFEHWGAKLVSCPGRHLTSLAPCRGGQTLWPEGRIRHCLATGRPDTVRFTWEAAVNAVALLSTVGNVALEKNLQGIWRVGLNWSAGRMRLAGSSLATTVVDYEEKSRHPCRSPIPTVNCRDLTLSTRTQTSEQEHSNLTASNRRPSTPYSCNTPQSFSRGTRSYAFSRSTKHV